MTDEQPLQLVRRRRYGPAVPRQRSAVCSMGAEARAVPALRAFTRHVAARWGAPAETIDALRVIATELVTNSVLHSGSPEVSLLLTVDGRTVAVEVRDTGTWRDHRRGTGTPDQMVDGRGLGLVHAYATTWRVRRDARGTAVRAELRIPLPAPRRRPQELPGRRSPDRWHGLAGSPGPGGAEGSGLAAG
ncbi:ATP-binding protein [Streptomyces hygroscopicus]|uniref:ATP-binding protein n=1 Tax=Streptomyces hygroscopicus TaxID=1912 RepID=UPI00202EA2C1|nr:ATP-binding protein [Streptomyces hygroscopicus]